MKLELLRVPLAQSVVFEATQYSVQSGFARCLTHLVRSFPRSINKCKLPFYLINSAIEILTCANKRRIERKKNMGNSKTKPEQGPKTTESTNSPDSIYPQLQIRNCVRDVRNHNSNFSDMYPNEIGASCGSYHFCVYCS